MSATNCIYLPLEDASRQIRLVSIEPADSAAPDTIVCRTETFQFEGDDLPPYKALSYQWGFVPGTSPIVLNGRFLAITNNLFWALEQFRGDTAIQRLWIDALCIDQNNLDEKGRQIPLMGRIFAHADEVLVWLMGGVDHIDRENLVDYFENWIGAAISAQGNPSADSPNNDQQPLSPCRAGSLFRAVTLRPDVFRAAISAPFDIQRWRELHWLLHCPYWKRIWIIQEIMLAKKARCYWGDASFDLSTFLAIPAVLKLLAGPEFPLSVQPREERKIAEGAFFRHSRIPPAIAKLSSLYGTKVTSGLSMSLADVVDLAGGSEATDARDRVYGLLGLVDPQDTIEPDYNLTAAETYTRFATVEIGRTNSLDVCFLSCGLVDRKTPDLPTWVPDLANTKRAEQFSLIKNLRGLCSAAGREPLMMSTSTSGHSLSIQGWRATARIYLVETKLTKEALFEPLQRFYTGVMKFLSNVSRINQLPSGLSVVELLFRTVVLDTSRYAPPHNLTRDELHAAQLINQFDVFGAILNTRHDETSAEDKRACDFPLPSLDEFWEASSGLFERKKEVKWRGSYLSNEGKMLSRGYVMKSNDLFWTEDGYMGLATHGVQPGDIVCVLTGACIPVVLRPKDGRFMLVGECYCFGLMHSEGTKGSDPEVFEIV
ncbi:heterokaryon incompatibility protein-domain-containing protein [Apiospora aurea]|uniref:Heterokaryon incompatibility protein-domain-containing protein n=1 Tax=Apiospora aurea TaxID=335848 RepID=A0ABR1Q9S2_9PEZI